MSKTPHTLKDYRPQPAPVTVEALLTMLGVAHKELCEAVQRQWDGGHALRLSMPARPDHDSDLIIGQALRAAIQHVRQAHPPEIARLTARAERAEQAYAEDTRALNHRIKELEAQVADLRKARVADEESMAIVARKLELALKDNEIDRLITLLQRIQTRPRITPYDLNDRDRPAPKR